MDPIPGPAPAGGPWPQLAAAVAVEQTAELALIEGQVGWGGLAGTKWLFAPAADIAVVLMTWRYLGSDLRAPSRATRREFPCAPATGRGRAAATMVAALMGDVLMLLVPSGPSGAAALRAATLAALCALAACSTPPSRPPVAAPASRPAVVAVPAPAVAAPAAPAPSTRAATDYGVASHWLCRPGRDDICAQPLVAASPGRDKPSSLRPDPAAPVDCFYVYPTISFDSTGNSDLVAGPEEKRAAQHQLAPFGSECRLFAPMYRQVTLAGLRSRLTGTPLAVDAQMAYDDVRAAWNHYLAHDNKGRQVVLIGHSQGARMLADLIAREIEGKPVQRQIVSALLVGANIAVPRGRDVGGVFKSMPLCRDTAQTGCVVAYTSFRADAPPPADTLFGRIGGADASAYEVACTNPAALAGGAGMLRPFLPLRANLLGQPTLAGDWGRRAQATEAAFAALPPLSAACVQADGASYLAVQLPADVPGDVTLGGQVQRNWGLHLVDMNLAMGNLVQIVRQQSRARTAGAAR